MTHSKREVLDRLEETGVVAVIRLNDAGALMDVSRALLDGGVTMLEVTMTVPDAIEMIRAASKELPKDVVLGAGTVLDAVTARLAILAGAEFIVGPCTDAGVMQTCRLYDKAVVPGALTPTEIVTAWKAGADVVKVFPGTVGTPTYFKDIRGPLPQIKLMPTGNVDLNTAPEYIRAGAVAVGVGGKLVDAKAVKAGDFAAITGNARRFIEVVAEARRTAG